MTIRKRDELIEKLSRMTVANGCTRAEATAARRRVKALSKILVTNPRSFVEELRDAFKEGRV